MLNRTPLFEKHTQLGARLVEFGGWEMPIQYAGILREHNAVRTAAGLFDIAHMGEFWVRGNSAATFLNRVLTNDVSRLAVGVGQYTLMCNPSGGVVDDLYVYRVDDLEFLLIVNASRIAADLKWLESCAAEFGEPSGLVSNQSDQVGAIALQGPRSAEIMERCMPGASQAGASVSSIAGLVKNGIARFNWRGAQVWAGRTGYTGEDGFELIAPRTRLPELWDSILDEGKAFGLEPAGLGARDTLRTEMCYPLYGHELDESISPLEAGVGFFVALNKPNFIGSDALRKQKAEGLKRRSVAFKMTGKSPPPRPDYSILEPGSATKLGRVTSGTQSPSLGVGIGLGLVSIERASPGTALTSKSEATVSQRSSSPSRSGEKKLKI